MSFFKKIIIILSLLFSGAFFLGINNISYAEGGTNITVDNKKTAEEKLSIYQTVGQSLYAITWPLIIISGKFMDNSVVYGSFIGMDVLLWKIWNIFRTFANYIIGFILIFSIFTLFLGGKLEKYNPVKLLPKLVISAVLVNASWFLIGACIDLSNILTYTISTLPLKIAGDKDNLNNLQIPKFGISFQDSNESIKVGIVGKDNKILPFCDMVNVKDGDDEGKLKILTQNGKCVYTYNMNYYTFDGEEKVINNTGSWIEGAGIISVTTFGKVKENLGQVSGVLGTLYASTINIGKTVNFPAGSGALMATDVIMKLVFLFALIIPLFTLAVILIMRTVILWMFIIISPLVFLFSGLGDGFNKLLGEKGKLGSLCCVVFLPVIVVFALSISFVFLNTITKEKLSGDFGIHGNNKGVSLDITKDKSIIIDTSQISSSAVSTSLFANFSETLLWIIRNIFAIGFMWILTFTALKSCKITSKVASSIQSFSQSMVKAAPIFPGGQSVSSLGQGLGQLKSIPQSKQQEQFKSGLGEYIKEMENRTSGVEQQAATTFTNHMSSVGTNINTKIKDTFSKKDKSNNFLYSGKKISSFIDSSGNLTKTGKSFASELGIDEKAFTSMLKGKTGEISTISEELKKEMLKKQVKNYINNDLLNKNTTLLQLDETGKTKLINQLKQAGFDKVNKIDQNKELYCVLKELGFKYEEILKLMATNLLGDQIQELDKKKIDGFKKGCDSTGNTSS